MSAMTDALNLVLLIGAATNDATPEQRHQLEVEVLPAMERYKAMELNEPDVKAVVQHIMGADWKPGEAWTLQ